MDEMLHEQSNPSIFKDPVEAVVSHPCYQVETYTPQEGDMGFHCFMMDVEEETNAEAFWSTHYEPLSPKTKLVVPSNLEFPDLDLKELPKELKYVFLGKEETYPVIKSAKLENEQEGKLIQLLKEHRSAFGWNVADLKGICPFLMHS